jgi:hypothetical protein
MTPRTRTFWLWLRRRGASGEPGNNNPAQPAE